MRDAIEFKSSDPSIGIFARQPKPGPEHELVEVFSSHVRESFNSRKTELAIFYEPHLETGFPDIVLVEYGPGIFDDWADTRSTLTAMDIKILHHLYRVNGADSTSITSQLGVDSKILLRSLERLLDSELILRRAKQWKPRGLKHTYAIRRIVAVEAKIGRWQYAFQQARTNQWFASASYVLSPASKPAMHAVDLARDLGIGVYTSNAARVEEIVRPTTTPLPACYASWLFNEWIGRYLHLKAE